MSYTLGCKLIEKASGVIGHRFEKAADSFLVIRRNASVLGDQFFLGRGKQLPKRGSPPSGQHISRVDSMFFKSSHIPKVERVCAQLIVLLCPATDPKKRSEFCLTQP